jgi:thiol-disulfide isomerase/thioredoxin
MYDDAYWGHLRSCDPDAMLREAEQLFEQVITDYGDVPYITRKHREVEAALRGKSPARATSPEEEQERREAGRWLARKQTLAEVAEGRLDAMRNLAVGKPAPEIDGIDLEGKPLKLSDHRGKVVVLVFWGSWCGPCMRQVPHERELVERLKGKPFALLGVNCDGDTRAARKAMESERITWPNWNDGAPGEGPIANRYRVRGFPTVFVLDAKGIIRHNQRLAPEGLDKAVDRLLEELAGKGPRT